MSSRVEAETSELRNINEILMLELQQKEEELNKVSIAKEKKKEKKEKNTQQIFPVTVVVHNVCIKCITQNCMHVLPFDQGTN